MNLEKSVLLTLGYHAIFEYPLKLNEIHNLLVKNKADKNDVRQTLKSLIKTNIVQQKNGYYFIAGEKALPKLRALRENISQKKLKKAIYFASLLKKIPTIEMVAITGALSMRNSTDEDDVDLMIVTKENTLWITRLLSNLILVKHKRSPKSAKQKDKACLNIFLDKSNLNIKDKNIYTAHEIAQLKPIFNRNNTFEKLLSVNKWVLSFLPNFAPIKTKNELGSNISPTWAKLLNPLSKKAQLFYMKSKRTSEKVGDTQVFFHPKKTQTQVLTKFRLLEKMYKINNS